MFGFTGDVDATPLLAFTGGALAFTTPVVVTNMTAPVGQALAFGETTFDGPVSVTVGGPVPMQVDPVSGLFQINAFSVMGGAQTAIYWSPTTLTCGYRPARAGLESTVATWCCDPFPRRAA